jgi:hypothetical protein
MHILCIVSKKQKHKTNPMCSSENIDSCFWTEADHAEHDACIIHTRVQALISLQRMYMINNCLIVRRALRIAHLSENAWQKTLQLPAC